LWLWDNTTVLSMESPKPPRSKKGNTGEEQDKSMLIIFLDFKRIVHKEFVLAGQTFSSAYCCDILQWRHENVRRLRPELWWQKNWL
jgi:hypothetical protein